MAGLAFVIGGPKGAPAKDAGEAADKASPEMSGEAASAKAIMSAVKGGDAGELEKALRAFVRACMDKGDGGY